MVTCRHKPSATRLFNSTFRQTIEKTLKPAILPFVMGPTGDASPPNSRTPGRGLQTGLWEAYILTVEISTQAYITLDKIYTRVKSFTLVISRPLDQFFSGLSPRAWGLSKNDWFIVKVRLPWRIWVMSGYPDVSMVTLKDMSDVRIPWCQWGYPEGYEWCQDTLMSVWLPWRIWMLSGYPDVSMVTLKAMCEYVK